jgi:ribonuclease HI
LAGLTGAIDVRVEVWVDGSCRGNPGPGGYAALLIYGKRRKEVVGGEQATTNQRMELRAAIAGLKEIKADIRREVTVYTDSQYLHRTMTEQRKKPPKANADLIAQLDEVAALHDVQWEKVPAHSGISHNEQVDRLSARESAKMALQAIRGQRDEG